MFWPLDTEFEPAEAFEAFRICRPPTLIRPARRRPRTVPASPPVRKPSPLTRPSVCCRVVGQSGIHLFGECRSPFAPAGRVTQGHSVHHPR